MSSLISSSSSHQIPHDNDFEKIGLNHIVFDFTVSQHKPTNRAVYKTISAALKAAPINSRRKFYIHVEGVIYEECFDVSEQLTNIVLIGDNHKTVVKYDRMGKPGTDNTGTIKVNGDGFVAMFISFENTRGDYGQAAAAVVAANRVAFYKCSFHGYQDTLYAISGNQFYRQCNIYGTVDFICGAAAAVFQNCNMYALERKDLGVIEFTAQNRAAKEETSSAFVIQNCNLTVAPGVPRKAKCEAFLGRPWSIYSTVVVMESNLDSIIQPVGWDTMVTPVDEDQVTYWEFRNRGDGANTTQRRKFRNGDCRDISHNPNEVKKYTVGEFINKDGWLAETLIPHYDGFAYIQHP